ncbi:MAG: hypothetical protein AAES65_06880 [Candidatus Thiodiazotropha sp. (ex. Lucinoma kazani)]
MTKKTKTPAPLNPEQTVSEAFEAILRHNFNYLLAWEQSARSWDDIEGGTPNPCLIPAYAFGNVCVPHCHST